MREILFRAKRKDNGEWIEGWFLGAERTANIIDDNHDIFPVQPTTVCQFTGLTDKNVNKVFEGDIVKFAKNIYQIVFSVGSFAIYDEQGKMISKIGGYNDHCYSLMDLYIGCIWEDNWAYDIEIIGNIIDNPELLE